MGTSSPTPGLAEAVFAAWLKRRGSSEADRFESILAMHAEQAVELRGLHEHWQRIEPILRLAGLNAGDPLSFANRLEAAHGASADPRISLDPPTSEVGRSSSELLKRLGKKSTGSRYRFEGEVARGGMGAILRVWDEDIRRHLAMKVVLGRGDAETAGGTPAVEPDQLARFLEEAQVTGQLDHPGIVPVHELGMDQDGRVFFTMKLVKGRDLKTIYGLVFEGEEGWNETRALTVILKVCEAVAYAHKKGVIHRDLKPANVMVGDFGEVYVMDWGLARVVGRKDQHDMRIAPEGGSSKSVRTERREEREADADSPIITMDGHVVGTPAYMPLEQAQGVSEVLTARVDVYAIGAMLYHLLARQAPYVAPGTRVSNRTVLGMVLQGPPTSLAELRRDAPTELVAICDKAMSRDAALRYADTLELAEDLRAFMEHRVVRAHRTGPIIELKKWVRRNRSTTAALLGLGITVLIAMIAAVSRARADFRSLLVSDARTADSLVVATDHLSPALPEFLTDFRSWIADANGIVDREREHARLLVELGDDPREAPRVQRLRALIESTGPDVIRLRAHVEGCARMASTVEALTLTSPSARERWKKATDSIQADALYRNLHLVPQLGLLPLEKDPKSGLWEFWHVLTGEEPARDSGTGRWVLLEATGIILVLLPGGASHLGSILAEIPPQATDEERYSAAKALSSSWIDPGHRVNEGFIEGLELDPFFISKYEMTQAQWQRLMLRNPSQRKYGSINPVETISWHDAVKAMRRSALELPTESQWEYACRAGTTSPFSSGWEIESLNGNANISDLTRAKSIESRGGETRSVEDDYPAHAPIGSFESNLFGLHDVHGNVWEWCRDGYRDLRLPRNGDGLDVGAEASMSRAIRGGSFSTNALAARSANRFLGGYLPTNSDSDLGVRPARPLTR